MADGDFVEAATQSPAEAGPAAFRGALGRFATGVTVVTAQGPDGPAGFTANSFASVSLDPPLVLWSPARASTRFGIFEAAQYFAVHVLAEDQLDLGRRFARGGHAFDGPAPERNPEGVPLIPGTLARFDCAWHAAHDGGDHLIIVGRVLRFNVRSGHPLVFAQGHYGGFRTGG